MQRAHTRRNGTDTQTPWTLRRAPAVAHSLVAAALVPLLVVAALRYGHATVAATAALFVVRVADRWR